MYSPFLSLPILHNLAHHLALEAIVEMMERFLLNYKAAPPSKKAKTSETEQEKSRKYASNKWKRVLIHHGMKVFVAPVSCYEQGG